MNILIRVKLLSPFLQLPQSQAALHFQGVFTDCVDKAVCIMHNGDKINKRYYMKLLYDSFLLLLHSHVQIKSQEIKTFSFANGRWKFPPAL